MTFKEKIEIIETRLKKTNILLSKYGFASPEINIENSKPLNQEVLNVDWSSQKRSFGFAFFEKDLSGKEKNIVSLSLSRIPYDRVEDFIGLSELCKKKNIDLKNRIEEVPHGFEKSCDFFFIRLEELISTSLRPYFKGKSWDNTCWTDWHNY